MGHLTFELGFNCCSDLFLVARVLSHPKQFVTYVSMDVGERAIRKVLRKAVAEVCHPTCVVVKGKLHFCLCARELLTWQRLLLI